jgi:hypothetical protein
MSILVCHYVILCSKHLVILDNVFVFGYMLGSLNEMQQNKISSHIFDVYHFCFTVDGSCLAKKNSSINIMHVFELICIFRRKTGKTRSKKS